MSTCDLPIASVRVIAGSTTDTPKVSILIPTFRRPELLLEAVRSALAQDADTSFEVVVVDNDPEASRIDELLSSLGDIHLTLYRNASNLGMFGNWNRCLDLARGQWITLLNDDDLLDASYLRHMMGVAAATPDAEFVACRTRVLDERSNAYSGWWHQLTTAVRRRRDTHNEDRITPLCTLDYFLNNPHQGSLGILFRRDVAIDLGGFRAELYPSADYFFFASYQQSHPGYLVQRTLASYRVLANESRKAEIAESWVAQGLQLRRELARFIDGPPWMLELYARLLAIQTARYCKAYWKSDLDVSATLARHGLPNLPVHALVLLLRTLLSRTCRAQRT